MARTTLASSQARVDALTVEVETLRSLLQLERQARGAMEAELAQLRKQEYAPAATPRQQTALQIKLAAQANAAQPRLSKDEWKIQQGRIARGEATPTPKAYVSNFVRTDDTFADFKAHCKAQLAAGASNKFSFQEFLASR